MSRTLRGVIIGAVSGFAATVPMSAIMLAGLPFFPRSQRRLPPKEITWNLAKRLGMSGALRHPDRARSHVITTIGHFGYGTTVGAIYPIVSPRIPGPSLVKGMIYGLAVWAASYLGWLPAADVRHSSLRDAPSRNAVMIVAHLVWGGALAQLVEGADVDRLLNRVVAGVRCAARQATSRGPRPKGFRSAAFAG